jgi:hypothetical protein
MKTERKKFLAVVIIAILLGIVSPFLTAVDDGPILKTWFQWLPVQVDLLVLPEGDFAMLGLAMLVLTAQYLLMFFLVIPMRPLLRRLLKIIIVPLRRGLFAH